MIYLFKGKKCKIDFDGDLLLVMDKNGNQVVCDYVRCKVSWIHKNGIFITGFYVDKYVELFFSYDKEDLK
jgi:hypothetical protein